MTGSVPTTTQPGEPQEATARTARAARTRRPRSPASHAALLVALVLSAGAMFFLQPQVVEAVRGERLDAVWLGAGPVLFSLVVVISAVDTWRRARQRGYFRGSSILLLAGSVAFIGLLLPPTFSEYRARTSPPYESDAWHEALLESRDPRVRVLVMEVAGLKPELTTAPELLRRGLVDPDPLVVRAAVSAVEHRAGLRLEPDEALARARALVESWRRSP